MDESTRLLLQALPVASETWINMPLVFNPATTQVSVSGSRYCTRVPCKEVLIASELEVV